MFAWNKSVRIEKMDPHTRRVSVEQTTPVHVINNPNGFRMEDIVNSMGIALSEIIKTLEAQAQSAFRVQNLLEQQMLAQEKKGESDVRPKRGRKRKVESVSSGA